MIAAGAALAWFADRQHLASIRAEATARAQLNEFEGKLKQVRSEESEIKQKAALFSNLRARGIIGEEQRLDWVELIKEIRDTRKLIDVQYEFSPQQSLEKGSAGGYAFKSSAMRLQMKLLHENDLLNFVNDLRSKANAKAERGIQNRFNQGRLAGLLHSIASYLAGLGFSTNMSGASNAA